MQKEKGEHRKPSRKNGGWEWGRGNMGRTKMSAGSAVLCNQDSLVPVLGCQRTTAKSSTELQVCRMGRRHPASAWETRRTYANNDALRDVGSQGVVLTLGMSLQGHHQHEVSESKTKEAEDQVKPVPMGISIQRTAFFTTVYIF